MLTESVMREKKPYQAPALATKGAGAPAVLLACTRGALIYTCPPFSLNECSAFADGRDCDGPP